MKCSVCGKKSQYIQCPDCGFDSSRDYEKYPTLAPIGNAPAVSALRDEWEKKGTGTGRNWRKLLLPVMIACAVVLAICIGAAFGSGDPETTEPGESVEMPQETTELLEELWKQNILRSDEIPLQSNNTLSLEFAQEYPVFGSQYRRNQILSVTFLDTLASAPGDAWDVSEAGDGRVLAWVVPNGNLYDLYIGAEGGVSGGESCAYLFCGYTNAVRMNNLEFLHTGNVQNAGHMFAWCSSLTALDVSSFDTANMRDMIAMFLACESLTELKVTNFSTENAQRMINMFAFCESLTSLDLSSFDTANVQYTTNMFYNCPAGDDWQHLLKE